MKTYKYLIVGGGMTADSAVRGIRMVDGAGEIGLISDEPDPPYKRPPLSKGLWKKKTEKSIWCQTAEQGVAIILGRRIVALDPGARQVTDDHGDCYGFEKLLLATGGTPRRAGGAEADTLYFRTVQDYRRLREAADQNRSVAVIGGGFIGSEIAAALAMNGKRVEMAFQGPGICGHLFPAGLSLYLNGVYQSKGVSLFPDSKMVKLESGSGKTLVRLAGGKTLEVDTVVAGLGISPNTGLASDAGLAVENGILVNEYLQTTHPDIFAAGDVANFYCPALAMRQRVEHEDNANFMGKAAGRNMAGERDVYHHLSYFYSDLFDLGYEAVGETHSTMQTIEVWREPNRLGVVFYMKAERVRGILFWNQFGHVDAGRLLISDPGPHTVDSLSEWCRAIA